VQTTHPGTIHLAGDTASGRACIAELGPFRDGSSQLTYAVDHDRYRRTPDGWKFTGRVHGSGTSTPRRWRARRPHAAGGAR
jgi:hypothetical protein